MNDKHTSRGLLSGGKKNGGVPVVGRTKFLDKGLSEFWQQPHPIEQFFFFTKDLQWVYQKWFLLCDNKKKR